jgi:hypothetical protein
MRRLALLLLGTLAILSATDAMALAQAADKVYRLKPYRARTFEKSAPRPSAIVGCAIIASRKLV